MNSLGLLPETPDKASLFVNVEDAAEIWTLVPSNAARVRGTVYVKNPPKLVTGITNEIDIGPPASETTLTPDFGGNSNSLREIPAVKI